MSRPALALALAAQLAGCITYSMHVDDPSPEAIGIFAGAELAVGVATGIGVHVTSDKDSLLEHLAIGILSPLALDLAIALGAYAFASDAVNSARPETLFIRR